MVLGVLIRHGLFRPIFVFAPPGDIPPNQTLYVIPRRFGADFASQMNGCAVA